VSNAGGSWGADSPQGEGWYQASDGRWYPPQQAAAAAPPPPAPAPVFTAPAPAPAPAAAVSGWQPGMIQVDYLAPTEDVPKFKWLYAFFTCIPQIIALIVSQILAAFSTYAAYFGILLYQRVHPRSHDNIVKAYRHQWRLQTYLLQWRNDVPANPTTGAIDDGADRATLSIAYGGEGLARFGPIIKFFKAIPELIAVIVAMIVAYIAVIVGIVNIVTKGNFGDAQARKVVDATRKAMAYTAYVLLTDVKPQA
jgi:hypothetical protein